MDTPSPCILRCLGDPQVTRLFWSERRCPFRRFSQERRLSILQNAIDNPDKRVTTGIQAIQLSPYPA